MRRTISLYGMLAAMGLMGASACGKGVTERTIANDQAQKKIIIGTMASAFRDSIVTILVEKYRGAATIEIRELGKLADIDPQNYSAIVVIDELQAWLKFNRTFKKLVDRFKDSGKLVVLMTAGDPKFKLDYQGVDAVCTASVKGKEGEVAEKLMKKIDDAMAR
jgi:ABC-type dipeptide/oligopeptide/nickel transport system ATPase component